MRYAILLYSRHRAAERAACRNLRPIPRLGGIKEVTRSAAKNADYASLQSHVLSIKPGKIHVTSVQPLFDNYFNI
jgi:hypothetical protein